MAKLTGPMETVLTSANKNADGVIGFINIPAGIGNPTLNALIRRELVERITKTGPNGDEYSALRLTEAGRGTADWLDSRAAREANQDTADSAPVAELPRAAADEVDVSAVKPLSQPMIQALREAAHKGGDASATRTGTLCALMDRDLVRLVRVNGGVGAEPRWEMTDAGWTVLGSERPNQIVSLGTPGSRYGVVRPDLEGTLPDGTSFAADHKYDSETSAWTQLHGTVRVVGQNYVTVHVDGDPTERTWPAVYGHGLSSGDRVVNLGDGCAVPEPVRLTVDEALAEAYTPAGQITCEHGRGTDDTCEPCGDRAETDRERTELYALVVSENRPTFGSELGRLNADAEALILEGLGPINADGRSRGVPVPEDIAANWGGLLSIGWARGVQAAQTVGRTRATDRPAGVQLHTCPVCHWAASTPEIAARHREGHGV